MEGPDTAGWVSKWFGMIRDYNMNNSRLHTRPHPRFIMDMADEYGIYITAEAAMRWRNIMRQAETRLVFDPH